MEEDISTSGAMRQRAIRRKVAFRLLAVVAIVTVWWLAFVRGRVSTSLEAVCRVEVRSWYDVVLENGDTVRISPQTGQTTAAEAQLFCADTAVVSGCFVSARGHLVTSSAAISDSPTKLGADSLARLLRCEQTRLEAQQETLGETARELDYYARTHSVTDDGYNDVMAFRAANSQCVARVDSALQLVGRALKQPRLTASLHVEATATVGRLDDSAHVAAGAYNLQFVAVRDSLLLLQTTTKRLPAYAQYFSLSALSPASSPALVVACYDAEPVADAAAQDVAVRLGDPHAEGGGVTDEEGRFCGLFAGRRTVSVAAIRRLCQDCEGRVAWWANEGWAVTRNVVLPPSDTTTLKPLASGVVERNLEGLRHAGCTFTYIATTAGQYAGRAENSRPYGLGRMHYADGSNYLGHFVAGQRVGWGTLVDSLATTHYAGEWAADTLSVGVVTDSGSTYQGELNAALQRSGRGTLTTRSGARYCGEWFNGQRHGFGYAVGERGMVRAGVWSRDRFRGEQMIYTADRVYGIDVSRYQHEIGRHRYKIDWPKVRITRLGAANASRIRGQQDYPVSFVYIKATQGTSIRSRYYAADAVACRRRGIPVGAYHFFSTKRGGRAQAIYFVKQAQPRTGDLPPVLDVEPYDSQVKAMGGRDAMFREIVAWVGYVRAVCGTAPVLYVSQSFVNKYMEAAPAALHDCPVWIARYGEYKPYVQLLLWQLSPRGRVNGIRGDVDINVFNGTREQFREFVSAHHVRR